MVPANPSKPKKYNVGARHARGVAELHWAIWPSTPWLAAQASQQAGVLGVQAPFSPSASASASASAVGHHLGRRRGRVVQVNSRTHVPINAQFLYVPGFDFSVPIQTVR
jgi:hypothetical protein